jgi:hypothetical protein
MKRIFMSAHFVMLLNFSRRGTYSGGAPTLVTFGRVTAVLPLQLRAAG